MRQTIWVYPREHYETDHLASTHEHYETDHLASDHLHHHGVLSQ
jgi:hypothetical protein